MGFWSFCLVVLASVLAGLFLMFIKWFLPKTWKEICRKWNSFQVNQLMTIRISRQLVLCVYKMCWEDTKDLIAWIHGGMKNPGSFRFTYMSNNKYNAHFGIIAEIGKCKEKDPRLYAYGISNVTLLYKENKTQRSAISIYDLHRVGLSGFCKWLYCIDIKIVYLWMWILKKLKTELT